MVSTSKKNTINTKEYHFTNTILHLLFLLVETIIDIKKNLIFFKITFFLLLEIKGNPIFKK